MDFTRELTAFPTAVQKEIYFAGRSLTPPEISLRDTNDDALRASAQSLHGFVMSMLSDMYDNPAEYHLFPGEYEQFLHGRKENGAKQHEPSKSKTMIAHVRNSVARYMLMLCFLGELGVPENGGIRLSDEAMKVIEKAVNTSTHPVSAEKRLSALSRVGVVYKDGFCALPDGGKMFGALSVLAANTKNVHSGFRYFHFECLDFRALNPKFKPMPEDYFRPLVADRYNFAVKLHKALTALGLRPVISTFWKVDYKFKGGQVMCMDTLNGDIILRLMETYKQDDPALINSRLEAESPEQQKYALRHVWRCTACATTHLGVFVNVLGKRQRVCEGGAIGFRWINPTEAELDDILRLTGYRCEIITETAAKS